MSDFFIGGSIGFTSAIITAIIQYLINRKREVESPTRPGCIFIITGALGCLGLIMLTTSWFLTGSVNPAIPPGIGVILGFFLGFGLMIFARLLLGFKMEMPKSRDIHS